MNLRVLRRRPLLTHNSQLNEVRPDSAEGAAGEESPERTGDERPYRFRYSLRHFKPINF